MACATTPGLSTYHTDFQFFFFHLLILQARELFLQAVEEEQNGALYEGKSSASQYFFLLYWNLFGIGHFSPPT